MNSNLRNIVSDLGVSKTGLVFINQLRMRIGAMFGNPETTSGGRALKFYASVRMRVGKGKTLKDQGRNIGQGVIVKVAKNKIAPPLQEAAFDLLWGQGFDQVSDVLVTAVAAGVVKQGGGFYSFEGKRISEEKGKNATKRVLDDMAELVARLRAAVLNTVENGDETGE